MDVPIHFLKGTMTHKKDAFVSGIKHDEDGWPLAVPELEADDFCRGILRQPKTGRHCLIGWVNRVVGVGHMSDSDIRHHFKEAIRAAVTEQNGGSYGSSIPVFNDTQPLETVASVWNAAMGRLGYNTPTKIKPCRS